MKKRIAGVLLIVILLVLTGCVTKDGKVDGPRVVLRYVDGICGEDYELLGRELIEQKPDNMEYYFRTKERGLEFKANSYLSPISIDGSQLGLYDKEISCNYVSVVHDLYYEKAKAVIKQSPLCVPDEFYFSRMYVLSFSDIEEIVDAILAADKVYQQELTYNSPEFLEKYPLMTVHLVWNKTEKEARTQEHWVNMTDIAITGQHEREELYDTLAKVYAQKCVDGEIVNADDVPEEYMGKAHVSRLDSIILNGEEMLYDCDDNPAASFSLTTEDYKYCWYSDDLASYMMVTDVGMYWDNMSYPLIVREYVHALGGTYDTQRSGDKCTSTWTIGADTWVMKGRYDDEIQSLTVEKNGKRLDIDYVTCEEDYAVGATFCVGVTVEDFSKMFGLRYEIDEEAGEIRFDRE